MDYLSTFGNQVYNAGEVVATYATQGRDTAYDVATFGTGYPSLYTIPKDAQELVEPVGSLWNALTNNIQDGFLKDQVVKGISDLKAKEVAIHTYESAGRMCVEVGREFNFRQTCSNNFLGRSCYTVVDGIKNAMFERCFSENDIKKALGVDSPGNLPTPNTPEGREMLNGMVSRAFPETFGKKIFSVIARGDDLIRNTADLARKVYAAPLEYMPNLTVVSGTTFVASTASALYTTEQALNNVQSARQQTTWKSTVGKVAKASAWSLAAVASSLIAYSTALDIVG